MIFEVFAPASIGTLLAFQAAAFTRYKALPPSAVAAPPRPAIAFRKDPQGWMIDALRRRKWLRRSLSLGSLAALLFAVGVVGYPFYTNLVQSRIQARLDRQLASPELKQAYLDHRLQEGDSL